MSDDTESVRQEPPGYPFSGSGEEIIYSSARDAENYVPGEDSWFAVSRLPETQTHVFNGREHTNPYRFTVHSPVRGSTSMFVKRFDAMLIMQAMVSIMADAEGGSTVVWDSYINQLISDQYTVEFLTSDGDDGSD